MDVDDASSSPKDDTLDGISRDDVEGHGLEMIVYRGDQTAKVQIVKSDIHAHIDQAVKCILDGIDEHNRGITELSEHLESKIFTDKQKENLMFLRLDEIKTHLRRISNKIIQTLLSVADTISKDLKTFTKDNRTRSKIMELKFEQSGMDLKHLFEQKFLENDNMRQGIEDTIKEVSKSQATLTDLLLNFIENSKKEEDSGKEQRGQGSRVLSEGSKEGEGSRTAYSKLKEEPRITNPSQSLSSAGLIQFRKLFEKGHYKKMSRAETFFYFC
ncbi:hypothetical protein Dimus_018429 [Dionaea muscipula]